MSINILLGVVILGRKKSVNAGLERSVFGGLVRGLQEWRVCIKES